MPRLLFFLITVPGIDTTSLLPLSTRHRYCPCRLPCHSAIFLSIFRKYNRQCLLPSINCILGIDVLKMIAKLEDLCVVYVSDEILRFLADLLRLLEVLKEGFFVRMILEHLDQLFDFVFTMCTLLFNCRKEGHEEFCNPRCCSRIPRYFLTQLGGHKMFLHLVHVDLVDQFSS